MKAIRFDHYGEPKDVLAVADKPVSEPEAGQIRVRVLLSPVNPSGLNYVQVSTPASRQPFRPG